MTTISAKVVLDSRARSNGRRLTTLELRYPRTVHSEFMTHRVFSRNAGSSRAIPVKRLIASVINDFHMPIHWGKNQPGMQAAEELKGVRLAAARLIWRSSGWFAIQHARLMAAVGGHKQLVNRVLEPYSHITVVCTSTEWENFFALRDHPDADPTIQALAREIKIVMDASTPEWLEEGEWHLPYLSPLEAVSKGNQELLPLLKKLSAARCARTSYLTHDGKRPERGDDFKLFNRLAGADPQHLSPTEHQATPANDDMFHANYRGWIQFRKEVDHAA